MANKTERRVAALMACALVAALLAGCSEDVFARRTRIASWSGDDIAANTAIQTINPWPREAFHRASPTLGVKIENGMKLYRAPPPPPPPTAGPPSTTDAAAPAAGPSGGPPTTTD